jgi:hypothetical protein
MPLNLKQEGTFFGIPPGLRTKKHAVFRFESFAEQKNAK